MHRISIHSIVLVMLAASVALARAEKTPTDAATPAPESVATEVDSEAVAPDAAPEPAVACRPPLIYKPPRVGKPAESVGGGTRGRLDLTPVVFALVPDHVGRTASAQPSFFWFIDRRIQAPVSVEFTLHAEGEIEPAVESAVSLPVDAGIHRVRLSDYGVELAPSVEYEWSIAVVMNPDDPSKDVVATGWIDRVQLPGLEERLRAEGKDMAAHVYAEEGLWYDALTEVDARIASGAESASWTSVRSELLTQVGLGVAASGDL